MRTTPLKGKFVPLTGLLLLMVSTGSLLAQTKPPSVTNSIGITPALGPAKSAWTHPGPKAYTDVITSKAVTDSGLFIVHRVEDKYYLEIPDSLFGRDILVVNRLSKAAAGMRNLFFGYAGDFIGENVIRFDRGPNNKVFIRNISFDEISRDSTYPMYKAVANSNIQPIVQAFDIAAPGHDSTGAVVEITSFLNSDNEILNFEANQKRLFRVGSLQSDKSYVNSVKSYPMNTEIKTVKTYTRSGGTVTGSPATMSGGASSGAFTVEINSSMLLLPSEQMKARYYDDRVGYFSREYVDFDANPQGIENIRTITRWRLEPRPEDVEKYKKGILVEPRKPIIFYIDPATPKKWVPYLIQGVNDWQVAFEKAGFKNAIMAKEAPANDPNWSLEDSRYSAIVYKPSDIPNASGPHVHDPRSGEILESHINWYHNVMELLRNWYFVQASPNDPRARTTRFDDELMGQLIRFVSSHEVGHTLGLRHNYGASSTVPVEKLRDKKWVEEHGHTPSIMDYARFNYVAQPEDKISEKGIFPRIGDYDIWAIEWGYRWYPDAKDAEDEKLILNKMTVERMKNKRLWFGRETNPDDPRSQNEDLGDNAMKAGTYGIRNLQRIIPNLEAWTREPDHDYHSLNTLYNEVVTQFGRYVGHVTKNIGGLMETPKTVDQPGAVFETVPKETQREAMEFLNRQVFTTPTWLLNKDIYSKIGLSGVTITSRMQEMALSRILSAGVINRLLTAEATEGSATYTLNDLMSDLKRYTFSEVVLHKPIDIYRRNLQKSVVERLLGIVRPATGGAPAAQPGIVITLVPTVGRNSDAVSFAKGTLRALQSEIRTALPFYSDVASRYHLQDLMDRIAEGLKVEK